MQDSIEPHKQSILHEMKFNFLPRLSAEAQEARHYFVSLTPHDLSENLRANMESHAKYMEEAYKIVQGTSMLVSVECNLCNIK